MKRDKSATGGLGSEFLRISDATKMLGFATEKAVRRAISEGRLPHYRFGRTILLKREDLLTSVKRVASRQEILA